ncbi:MAG: bifunctional phosphopantothenoylcysteine decarboxylase/phosphopantothenate--cysteine ligase CoaBC [Chloroflexi bacterium]|nr:bifunctional phosphopantothenoylcysteine decarboxylase/phosphopantothenate--cysteine ligase CoaBC [Chloroflexota bacterium]
MSGPPRSGTGGRLAGRLIALGVSGSIAAYRTPDLVRLLQAEGAEVVAILTPSAGRFVARLALEALTRHPVEEDVLALLPDGRIGHIVVADTADAIVVAPATAHWLAAMASGLAGDVVTATCLATTAPVVVAPAMDGEMYAHPATRANVARLRDGFGYRIVEPEAGPLASGQTGVGRLAALPAIVDAVAAAVAGRPVRAPDALDRPPIASMPHEADLTDRHIIVTAGGTAEPIDPVRSITNRSSGRMGVAIAEAALDRGARVTVIAAGVSVPLPARATVIRAQTTAALHAALVAAIGDPIGTTRFDALLMAAAVSDFRPVRPAETKLPRGAGLTLELEPTADLLADVARIVHGSDANGAVMGVPLHPRPILVGFAAETGSLDRARDKLRRKGIDLMVANDITEAGSGFATETNRVTIFSSEGEPDAWPLMTKREVADRLLDIVAWRLDERDEADQTDAGSRASRPMEETVS